MSEKLSFKTEVVSDNSKNNSLESKNEFDLDIEAEFEKLNKRYGELNEIRLGYEADGRQIHDVLKVLLSDDSKKNESNYQSKIAKLKTFFEVDEKSLANVEVEMIELEEAVGFESDQSKRFDNCEDDVMVYSSILFHDRINSLKEVTGDSEIDSNFVQSVIDYIRAIEHDENSFLANRFDDVSDRQAYISNCQRRRSICHNNMISSINKLNDTARKFNKKPLTYRNLATNSATNDYRNDLKMHHDRVTAARYVSEIIHLGYEEKIPKTNYFEEI